MSNNVSLAAIDTDGRSEAITAAVASLLVMIVAGFRFGRTVADPDLWGHVLNGLDTVAAGGYIGIDQYSYLSGEQPWINHHWLANVVMGWQFEHFGTAGLVALKAFIALGVIAVLFWWLMRSGLPSIRAALVGLVVVALLTPTFGTFRPQLFTVVFTLVLMLVMVGVEEGRSRLLWVVPPLFVVWANAHGGVLAGLGILATWAVIHAWRTRGRDRFFGLAALGGAVLGVLVNPNGWNRLKFLIETATISRPEIQDWQSIDLGSAVGILYLVLAALVVVALFIDRKALNPALTVPLLVLLVAPLVAWRHLQLFALAAVILGGSHLAGLSSRIGPSYHQPPSRITLRAASVALAVAVLVGSLGFGRLASCIRIDAGQFEFPQRAAVAWASLEPVGNTVVPFNWGEYVRWQFGPDVQVSIDGRRETVYSESVYQANLAFINGAADWDGLLHLAPTQWVFIPTPSPAVGLLDAEADWEIVYQDEVATILAPEQVALAGDPNVPADGHGLCFPADV